MNTKSHLRIGILLVMLSILAAATATTRAQEENERNIFTPLVAFKGDNSKIQERNYHRVTTREEWAELWRRHKGEPKTDIDSLLHGFNTSGRPAIDFSKCMVIAVFLGNYSNSAGVLCKSVTEEKDEITVRFDNYSFQTLSNPEYTVPFGFFILPLSPKKIILQENVQSLINHPPIWKTRTTFRTLLEE